MPCARVRLLCVLLALVAADAGARNAPSPERFHGGYVALHQGWSSYALEVGEPSSSDSLGASGGTGGLRLGSGTHGQGTYYGLELGAYLFNDADHQSRGVFAPADEPLELDVETSAFAALRLGRLVGDAVLIYGSAGAQATRLDVEWAGSGETRTLTGPRLAAGVEVANRDHISLRLEYSLTLYQDERFDVADGETLEIDRGNAGQFLLAFGYRFGPAW